MSIEDTFGRVVHDVRKMGSFCVFVGRLGPMQLGHQFQVRILAEGFPGRHLLALGSCSHSISHRHMFNYADRSDFVRAIYPHVRIIGIPDSDNNDDVMWFRFLDDYIRAAGGDPQDTVFLGGSEGDVEFYEGTGRKVYIVNRFDGTTTKISAEEVRDALIHGRSLDGMLDPRLIPIVQERFTLRYHELRRT